MSAQIKRFRISYLNGSYRVSIPNYEGGEVVRAEHYDDETGKLLRVLREIAKLHAETAQTPTALARALHQASASAQSVLVDWE